MRVTGICYLFALVLCAHGAVSADGGPEKAPPRQLKHLSWSINDLVGSAELIVEARLERVDKLFSFGHRCLVMKIERTIAGRAPGAPSYLVAPPRATIRLKLSPAILFAGSKYLLFLVHDANTAKAALELDVDPDNVFSVSGRWRGAIVLDGAWPEVCNGVLEQRGLLPEELHRGTKATEHTPERTMRIVEDMVTFLRAVPEGDRSGSDDQRAAMNRLKASQHPWAGEFIRGLAKTVPDQKRKRSGVREPAARDRRP